MSLGVVPVLCIGDSDCAAAGAGEQQPGRAAAREQAQLHEIVVLVV